MLSNFQIGSRSLVQSFLVGQPEFRGILQRPEMHQLKQRVIASYHLGPLDSAETRHYVEHRLRHVGWAQDPRIEDAAFARIHAASGGVPRRINTLCDRLLLGAYLNEQHAVTAQDVDTIAAEMDHEMGTMGVEAMHGQPSRLEARVALLEASHEASSNLLKKLLRIARGAGGTASGES